ncbi:MAG: DNA repair protein RecN [Traorella sp.]
MFREIYVKNFVLIDDLHLDFNQGMSVFTGETGAGKSLLIDAISLLCGSRASSEYVSIGKDYALIEGVFSLAKGHPVYSICEELGIEIEDDLIVTRKITNDGKSNVKINYRNVPLTTLKNIMSYIIDIHSQHDTQYLLNNRTHLSLLDEFCQEHELISKVNLAYKKYKDIFDEYQKCKNKELIDDLDYLKYQLKEIEEADITEEKVNEYTDELKNLNNFEKIHEILSSSYESLNGNQQILEILYQVIHDMEHLKDFDWSESMITSLNDYYYGLEEIASQINNKLSSLDYDENRVNEISEYLYHFNQLKRKYGNSVHAILNKKEELSNKINLIEHRQEIIEELEKKKQFAYHEYEVVASKLSARRKEKAKELEKKILQECSDLYLDKARFEVHFTDCEASSKGIDKVEFYISMNPGEPLKPLCNVASGGELSRLMLGLKTIFTDLTSISTIIFDEIDTGVSGKVALAIGKKMRKISKSHQLFAITHLASVAACAQHHYVVEKIQSNDMTKTNVKELTEEEIIETLAMISNNSNSESAKTAAKELYNKAQTN